MVWLISTEYSYIQTVPIPAQEYVVKDPIMSFQIPLFSSTDPELEVVYPMLGMVESDKVIDSEVFIYDNESRTLKIHTLQNSKVGTYNFILTAKFNVPIPYSVNETF